MNEASKDAARVPLVQPASVLKVMSLGKKWDDGISFQGEEGVSCEEMAYQCSLDARGQAAQVALADAGTRNWLD